MTEKIRKKGDWLAYTECQAANLLDDEQNWDYCARFAMGLKQALKLARWYFDLSYEENSELSSMRSSAFPENRLPVVIW